MREQGGRRLNVSGVLRHLGVSRSGYNTWKNRIPSNREQRKNKIKDKICDIYDESHQNYGAPKIAKKLKEEGETISKKTVGNYMREMGLKAQWIKPYTITSIMDLYSRKIISWVLSDTLETKWVVEAVNKAKKVRNVSKPLILHSDRGRQYTAKDYADATSGMTLSYSKKAYPWDNACIESFHSLLKREWINRFKITDYNHAYKLIFEYIEAFYNTVRIHSHCDYVSPNEYEKKYWIKLRQMEINVA